MRLFSSLLVLLALLAAPALHAQGTPSWQMRVAYDMDITMDAPAHQFTGTQRLTLTNESPDTLTYVYYHLYFNAFQPQSLMAERNRQLPDPDSRVVPRIFELGPDEIGYHRVASLTQDGTPIPFEIDDTLLRATLARPIPPGGRATFEMAFNSQVPLQTRRSGRDSREGIDYSMSQWYPKMAYYDSRGWHADPYVGREFYAPYGSFDVTIDLPAEYVIGATGVLQNPGEIGHGYTDRAVEHTPGSRLKWHFVAENVHDFAWAADRDYIHDKIEGDGITYHLFYQPDVSEGWQFLRQFVPAVIQYYSQRIGPYVWPQFTVAQAGDGGMEYPMVNFITGGRTPGSLVGVTAHEAAHEWFYGMLGSNESDYPWMDEGFTSYMTGEAIAAILSPGRTASHAGATRGIMTLQQDGTFEPLNAASDWFETNRAYSVAAYSGGEMVMELLGYVLGDSLRDVFIKEYYDQYLLAPPSARRRRARGRKRERHRAGLVFPPAHAAGRADGLRRHGRLGQHRHAAPQRPDGVSHRPEADARRRLGAWVTIPTSEMQQAKPVPDSWVVAPAWGWTRPTYTLTLDAPGRIVKAEIDPMGRTPDYNRLNNSNKTPVEVAFLKAPSPSLDAYSYGWRPLVTYADRFGVGIGVQLRGAYWMNQHVKKAMLTVYPQAFDRSALDPDVSSEFTFFDVPRRQWYDALDYALSYETPLRALSPQTRIAVSAEKHLGVMQNRVSVSHTLGRWAALGQDAGTVTLYGVHTLQPTQRGFAFDGVSSFLGDHGAYAGARFSAGRGGDRLDLDVQVGGSFRRSSFAYNLSPDPSNPVFELNLERFSNTRVTLKAQKDVPAGPLTLRARTLLGFGSDALAPYQHYRMGAASLEQTWQTAASRQIAGLNDEIADDVPFQAFSGFGPVGYAVPYTAYTLPTGNTPSSTQAWMGTVEVGLPRLTTPLLAPLGVTAFSGAGIGAGGSFITTDTRRFSFDNLIADAGLGLSYDLSRNAKLRRLTAQSDFLQSFKVAARFPLWLSDPEMLGPDEDAFAFRYLFGIEVGW